MNGNGTSHRRFPLQWHLVLLVAAAALPFLVFGAVLTLRVIDDAEHRAADRLGKLTEMLVVEFERQLQSSIGTLEAVALSERFDRNDLAGIQRAIDRVVSSRPDWHVARIYAANASSGIPAAADLNRTPVTSVDTASLQRTVRTRRPAVGDLSYGHYGSYWTFPIHVPVIRGDSLLYVVSAIIRADALNELVSRTIQGDEWTRTIVDSRSVVVARTRDPQKWVGTPGTPSFRTLVRSALSGMRNETTLEGRSVVLSFRRSALSDWTVCIAAPAEAIYGSADQAMTAVVIVGLLVIIVSAFGAHLLSRHVRRGIERAAAAASSLAVGRSPEVAVSSISEVAELFDALSKSAALLERRERERDENLARAQTARALAENASRAKDEFLATLGHELRNPLAPIVLAVEMLREDHGEMLPELDVIDRQVAHLRRLIDDLLDVSRIARSKVVLQFETVDLRDVITRAVEMSRPLIERRAHRLSVELGLEPIDIYVDPVRLAQVFDNLFTNAARYTPAGGNIRLTCTRRGDSIEVAISDDGEGISAELLPNIFDLFVQGHSAGSRSQGGLGIGLALVRSLVQLHGGSVRAESNGPGHGSTFTVSLPLSTVDAAPVIPLASTALPAAAKQTRQGPTLAVEPIRVLIVDDNEDAAALLAEYLRHHGVNALAVHDASDALEQVASFDPAAAILDIGMPGVDGYELAASILARTDRRPPVLFALSGFGQPSDVERSLRSGFRHHFIKPASPLEILSALRTVAGETGTAMDAAPERADASGETSGAND